MRNIAALTMLLLALTGCATTGRQSPQQAVTAATTLFNGQGSSLIWVPSSSSGISGAMASALIGSVGLDSPIVLSIHQAIAPASKTDVRVTISGTDSTFAAKAAIAALNSTSSMLPKLQLAFIGSSADADEVRSAVEAKGGKFLHSAPNGS